MGRAAPDRYVSTVKQPADFDAFWKDVLDQASRVPLKPETVHDPLRSSREADVYQVRYDSLDWVRIFGWYSVPKQRDGRLPAILYTPGYAQEPPILKDWAKKGYAALSVAPRGKVRSRSQFDPGYPGLLTHNIVDRNSYSYRGFYVDAWRAVDYLLTRDEVDAERIGVTGISQGGALTVTTAAMRPEIRAAAAGAPYLCGFVDNLELTCNYPYQEINDYLRIHPESRQAVEETLAYFDILNFADKMTCPFIVYVGLQDNVCPAETGFALFRLVGSADKKMYPYEAHSHMVYAPHDAIVDEFFSKHLRP